MTLPAGLLKTLEILAIVAGVAYVILAARRNRLCWIAGGVSSLFFALLFALRALPMQAGLNVFYVAMSVYGWWAWARTASEGELPVGHWPLAGHAAAALVLTALSFLTAHWLAAETHAAWPLLDSLTTWFSLFATWLVARAKIENWLYWIVIDGILVFVFFAQQLPFAACLFLFYIVISIAGFIGWRRRFKLQTVAA